MVGFHTVEISDPAFEMGGLRTITVKSRALGRRADATVWAPRSQEIGTLLILLHGVYGSHWAWALKAGVHKTARRMMEAAEIAPIAIIMPSDGLGRDGSAYLKHSDGEDAESWVVHEVPEAARLTVPALRPDARIVIGGLSMGGYGALRLGAKFADKFSGISAHSAITDISQMSDFVEEPLEDYLKCGSREGLNPLYWLEKQREILPPLRFDCGVDDSLLEPNRTLHRALADRKIAHTYEEFAGGHNWPYWQQHVSKTLRFANEVRG